MTVYLHTNIIGCFVFNEKGMIKESVLFKNPADTKEKKQIEEQLEKKHKLQEPDQKILKLLRESLNEEKYLKKFRTANLIQTKNKIKQSVNEDNLISQALNSMLETEKIINTQAKRLSEWYGYTNPEFVEILSHPQKLSELILKKSKKELLKEIQVEASMGPDFSKEDLKPIKELAQSIQSLKEHKEQTKAYLETVMKKYCPNLLEVAGVAVGAKLIAHAGSLKKLVLFPSSTIQVLGAEKALFRHIKTGARTPRHGLIVEHTLLSSAPQKEHGKRARALASAISQAVKIDYFKGAFIGKKLRENLEKKFK